MRQQETDYLSASQIADLGFCERFVVLTHRHGRRDPPDITAARERGNRAHEEFYGESVAIARGQQREPSRRPCFIVQRVFEEGSQEVAALRRLRDQILIRSIAGRGIVALYDASSAWLTVAAGRVPSWALAMTRDALRAIARVAPREEEDRAWRWER